MPQEGAMLMSRLEMVSPTRAKIVMEGLYKDLERRIEASQPGLCPVDLARAFLELCYAVILPAAGSAIIFNIGASSGGTDIIAMILKKYSSMNIGTVLMLVDIASVVASYFIFGVETGLFSTIGLAAKSLVIDDVIENINLCKCFNIICDDPKPICDFIINGLNRSATVYHAEGAFTHHDKTVIMTTMKRSQALKLRNYIKRVEPTAFMLISNSSEIIGKGYLAN